VVDENGEMLGVMSPHAALRLAMERGLDLVEISPNAKPPVCKIMNHGKYKYELQKKAQAAKKKQKVVETKEIKVRPTIAEGDYQVAALLENAKVEVEPKMEGRQIFMILSPK